MSRTVIIKGVVKIHSIDLAREAIEESGIKGIQIIDNQFQFSGYDYFDGNKKYDDISIIEGIYQKKQNDYFKYLEEEEKKRIEEEKRIHRENQKEKVLENAKKHGYELKKETTNDNKIKLVLQRRVY